MFVLQPCKLRLPNAEAEDQEDSLVFCFSGREYEGWLIPGVRPMCGSGILSILFDLLYFDVLPSRCLKNTTIECIDSFDFHQRTQPAGHPPARSASSATDGCLQ